MGAGGDSLRKYMAFGTETLSSLGYNGVDFKGDVLADVLVLSRYGEWLNYPAIPAGVLLTAYVVPSQIL